MAAAKRIDDITHEIIGCGIQVHGELGPGLLERVYVLPMVWELHERGLKCMARVPLDVEYRGRRLPQAYFIDLFVEDLVVVELKSVEVLLPIHVAQTITYVRLARKPAGLLINFNVKRLVDGVRRVLNDRAS